MGISIPPPGVKENICASAKIIFSHKSSIFKASRAFSPVLRKNLSPAQRVFLASPARDAVASS